MLALEDVVELVDGDGTEAVTPVVGGGRGRHRSEEKPRFFFEVGPVKMIIRG